MLTNSSNLRVVADDFAIYRQDALKEIAADTQAHPLEKQASTAGLFYHKRRGDEAGNIGSYGYGAGVAMSTMDALAIAGGRASYFPTYTIAMLMIACKLPGWRRRSYRGECKSCIGRTIE
jgi:succinyl-CoA synthetase beta subunit